MTSSQRNKLYFLGVVTLLALLVLLPTFVRKGLPAWWPSKPIKLGLDLRGGTYLVLHVQTPEAIKGQLRTMSSSIKRQLTEEHLDILQAKQSTADSLEVILLSDRSLDRVDQLIRKDYPFLNQVNVDRSSDRVKLTYQLRPDKQEEVKRSAVDQAIEVIRNRIDQFGVAEPSIQRLGQDNIIVQLPDITDLSFVRKTIGSVAQLEFRLVSNSASGGSALTIHRKDREGRDIILEDEILMTGESIDQARVDFDSRTGEAEVNIQFNSVGASTFARVTGENVKRQLAIILDGVVQSSPVIQEKISGGAARISGSFTVPDANRLAIVLRSGALPAPLSFEEERVVGATLGADSIRQGIISTLVATGLVIVFMWFYYRRAGVLAVWCVILNLTYLLTALSLLGATLTLPGIAGLALTIGMAVDANVIIYERIREELRAGVTARASVESGFHKAHWTILDANLTTLLTGIILYIFGTGPIKGFAVTLSIGIVTTIITALYVSKLGFDVLEMKNSKGELSI